jgi:hypothetical protein
MDQPCRYSSWGGEIVAAACPACGHTNLVHPSSQSPGLDACVICSLLADQEEFRDWARSISEAMLPTIPLPALPPADQI